MTRSDYRLRPDSNRCWRQCYSHAGAGFQHNHLTSSMTILADRCFQPRKIYQSSWLPTSSSDGMEERILSEELPRLCTQSNLLIIKFGTSVGYCFGIVGKSQDSTYAWRWVHGNRLQALLSPENRIGFFVACNIMDGRLLDEVSRNILTCLFQIRRRTSTISLTTLPRYTETLLSLPERTGFPDMCTRCHKDGRPNRHERSELRHWAEWGWNDFDGHVYGQPRGMIQSTCFIPVYHDKYSVAFRGMSREKFTHLFRRNTAFENISWYETAGFQRSCLSPAAFFVFISMYLPIVGK